MQISFFVPFFEIHCKVLKFPSAWYFVARFSYLSFDTNFISTISYSHLLLFIALVILVRFVILHLKRWLIFKYVILFTKIQLSSCAKVLESKMRNNYTYNFSLFVRFEDFIIPKQVRRNNVIYRNLKINMKVVR